MLGNPESNRLLALDSGKWNPGSGIRGVESAIQNILDYLKWGEIFQVQI